MIPSHYHWPGRHDPSRRGRGRVWLVYGLNRPRTGPPVQEVSFDTWPPGPGRPAGPAPSRRASEAAVVLA